MSKRGREQEWGGTATCGQVAKGEGRRRRRVARGEEESPRHRPFSIGRDFIPLNLYGPKRWV